MRLSSERPYGADHSSLNETTRLRLEYQRRAREIPADAYSLARPGVAFAYTQRLRRTVQALAQEGRYPPSGLRICEVGCGTGQWLVDFVNWGAVPKNLCGVDLDPERLQAAKERVPGADLRAANATHLPWAQDSFDIVLQSTVFTSILDQQMKQAVAAEMLRVLKPGGLILWYDFRYDNPRNPNVRGVKSSEIRSLFPNCAIRLTRVTLAPPIARLVVPISWILALALEHLPFIKTHYLGIIRKPRRNSCGLPTSESA